MGTEKDQDNVRHLNQGEQAFADLISVLSDGKVSRVVVAYYCEEDEDEEAGWSYVRASRPPSPIGSAIVEDVGAASLLSLYVRDWYDSAMATETTHEVPRK